MLTLDNNLKAGSTIVSLKQLQLGYPHSQGSLLLARNLTEVIGQRELIALVGSNGTGKSTLLRTVAGMQSPLAGEVSILGKRVNALSARQLAKFVSVILTDKVTVGYTKAAEVVAMGRFPHTGWLGSFLPTDRRKVEQAIQLTGIEQLLKRSLYQLSDGERQKVMIARALAQDTPLMLLDEPTTHLDVTNRVSIIELLRKLVHDQGKSILFSTHDIELALQVSDRIWLMHDQKISSSVPEDLVLSGALDRVMGSQLAPFDLHSGTFKITPHANHTHLVALQGSGIAALWTKRALERTGYRIQPLASLTVEVVSPQKWYIIQNGETVAQVDSVSSLLQELNRLTKEPTAFNRLT